MTEILKCSTYPTYGLENVNTLAPPLYNFPFGYVLVGWLSEN